MFIFRGMNIYMYMYMLTLDSKQIEVYGYNSQIFYGSENEIQLFWDFLGGGGVLIV